MAEINVRIRTVSNQQVAVTVAPTDSIAVLKTRIFESFGAPVDVQKLIFSGKILSDNDTLEGIGFKESDWMVLLVTKPKTTAATCASAAPTTASTPVASTPKPSTSAGRPTTAASAPIYSSLSDSASDSVFAPVQNVPSPAAPSSQPSNDPMAPVTGAAYDAAVKSMMEMGFPRDQITLAMRAAFNLPDRAVEYLTNGIPANLERLSNPAQQSAPAASPRPRLSSQGANAAPSAASGQSQNLFHVAQQYMQNQSDPSQDATRDSSGLGSAESSLLNGLTSLSNDPRFDQLRQVIQINPHLLHSFLQHLSALNPGIFETISSNPEAFLNMLASEINLPGDGDAQSHEADASGIPASRTPAARGNVSSLLQEAAMPASQIQITEDDAEAVDRLVALGFDRIQAVEAYLACDKNEEHAANFLCDNNFN